MKVSLKWLRDYIDITAPVSEIAEKLTMAGLEVASIEVRGSNWDNVVVGKLMEINPHPNADRLRLVTVDLSGNVRTVVCGAPNLTVGDKIAFASVGAELIDGHTGEKVKLKPAKIRGVVSEGMVCSEKELGLSESHDGILVLPAEAPVGIPLADFMGDTVLDIEVTPNRPDCLSVIGIAREIGALTDRKAHIPDLPKPVMDDSRKIIDSYVSVTINEPELCPRYSASMVTGITIKPSPQWMQQRLLACGMRPINNVVDVTNYVMLEYGQPLHAFDFREITDGKIIIRRAFDNETIRTLDGIDRKLNGEMLVISDPKRSVAVAGIMGGEGSEVMDSTTTVLIESANFNQAVIHKGSIALKLPSEASSRYEKGLSRELPMYALLRATQLMQELTGGKVIQGIIDAYPGKVQSKPIMLSAQEIKRLVGIEVTIEKMVAILESLGFGCSEDKGNVTRINVNIPWWRTDVTCAADLVEEIARIIGYDNIPVTQMSSPIPTSQSTELIDFRQKLKDTMVTCGFNEILTYSLINIEAIKKLSPRLDFIGPEPARIAYPMSRELEYLRTSLRPGVLMTLSRNEKNQQKNIRLFELGKIFIQRKGDLPIEKEMLSIVMTGMQNEIYWQETAAPVDFFYAKGIAETLLMKCGLNSEFITGQDESLSPGVCCDIVSDGNRVGVIGEIHPNVVRAFDVSEKVFLIEFDVENLFSLIKKTFLFKPIPRYPAIVRDLALVVDENITYQQLKTILEEFTLIKQITLFDIYRGDQIPKGKKSLAIRLLYQSDDRTLTDTEVDTIQKDILAKLEKEYGASLRI